VTERIGEMEILRGTAAGHGRRTPLRTYRAGRICVEGGCETVLSIYNRETRCAAHALFVDLSGGPRRGRPSTLEAERIREDRVA
jgi:hypothetical protein